MLTFDNVGKSYGSIRALEAFSMCVERGEVIGGGGASKAGAILAAYGALFALLASFGYRRDERARYA